MQYWSSPLELAFLNRLYNELILPNVQQINEHYDLMAGHHKALNICCSNNEYIMMEYTRKMKGLSKSKIPIFDFVCSFVYTFIFEQTVARVAAEKDSLYFIIVQVIFFIFSGIIEPHYYLWKPSATHVYGQCKLMWAFRRIGEIMV